MKRVCGVLLVLMIFTGCLSFSLTGFSAENEADLLGNDPWIGYGHDQNGSCYSKSMLKAPLVETDNWPFEAEGGSRSFLSGGTAVYNGILYTQYMPNTQNDTSEVIAINIEDNEELWRTELDGGYAWSVAPYIDVENDVLYVATGKNKMFIKEGPQARGTSKVTALSLESGEEIWQAGVQGTLSGGLVYENGGVYVKSIFFKEISETIDGVAYTVADDGSMVTKLDAESEGEILWEAELDGAWYFEWDSPPVVKDDIVFASTSGFKLGEGGMVRFGNPVHGYAIDAESGDTIWENTGDSENTRLSGGICVDEEYAYFCFTNVEGNSADIKLYAIEKDSGSVEWEYSTSGITYWTTPIYNESFVFFVSQDGTLYAINKENGKKAWSKKVADLSQGSVIACTDQYVISAASVVENNSLTGSKVQMYDLEAKGKKVWDETFEEQIKHISIYGNYIFISGRKSIYSYKSETPILSVSPDKIDLGKIERATKREVKILVKNIGIEGLVENVTVSDPWMKLSTDTVDDNTNEIILTVDTTGLLVEEYFGKVIFTGNGGNKTIPVTFKVIDTQAPKVEWDYSGFVKIGEDWYTNQTELVLKGKTEPMAMVKINGQEAEVDADGLFEFSLTLQEGKNEITYETADDIPNQATAALVIYLDTKAPLLTLTTEDYSLYTEASAYIMGQTDDKEAEISVNGEIVPIAPNGSFAKMVILEKGVNKFIVEAKDKIGNITSIEMHLVYPDRKLIILVIGKKDAEVNGDIVKLDVPPMIQKGRTLVPIRFVSESFGAEVDYVKEEQKVTVNLYGKLIEIFINRTTAKVNGQPVILDLPAMIIQGRTLVPLRFVSENLGAKVDWDGKTQTITITFPAPQ
ncbi:PQQ-binding-like beta-propeller repeat protein [bacterium]|nr:PQQ-binding-like beta-propeller repeat protein [bacterium]